MAVGTSLRSTGYRYGFAGLLIVVIAVSTVLWSQLFAIAVHDGWLWTLFGSRWRAIEEHMLEARLLDARAISDIRPIVVAGDRDFLDQFLSRVPAERDLVVIEIPRMNLSSALQAVRGAQELKGYRAVFVQNLPVYWADVPQFGPTQQLGYLLSYDRRWNWKLLALSEAQRVFDTLAKVGRRSAPVATARAPTLVLADFEYEKVRSKMISYPPSVAERVYWVADRSRPTPNTAPELLAAFDQRLRSQSFDPKAGHFLDPDDVPASLSAVRKAAQ